LHQGNKKQNGEPVSVLRFSKKGAGRETDMAINLFKSLKTLRHPHILAFMDGMDNDTECSIVTEPVVTLQSLLLKGEVSQESAAWGLHCVLQALGFVNESCMLVHGNICPESIFVTRGGDWKLGGFYLSGPLDTSGPNLLFREWSHILPNKYKSPEVSLLLPCLEMFLNTCTENKE